MNRLLYIALGAFMATVFLMTALVKKPAPPVAEWVEPEDGIQPPDPYPGNYVWPSYPSITWPGSGTGDFWPGSPSITT